MKELLVKISFLVLLSLVRCQEADDAFKLNPKECGQRPVAYSSVAAALPSLEDTPIGDREKRFINSEQSNTKDWPWQVALQTSLGTYVGTLINSQWVLTSVYTVRDEVESILIGAPKTPQVRKPDLIIQHPRFDKTSQNYGIALIKLDKPVTYTKYVSPICIPPNRHFNHEGDEYIGIMTGYKTTNGVMTGSAKEVIKTEAHLKLLDDNTCRGKIADDTFPFSPKFKMCAQADDTATHLQETADRGSPLVEKFSNGLWYQTGVFSSTNSRSDEYFYVFSRVSRHYQWILDTITDN